MICLPCAVTNANLCGRRNSNLVSRRPDEGVLHFGARLDESLVLRLRVVSMHSGIFSRAAPGIKRENSAEELSTDTARRELMAELRINNSVTTSGDIWSRSEVIARRRGPLSKSSPIAGTRLCSFGGLRSSSEAKLAAWVRGVTARWWSSGSGCHGP